MVFFVILITSAVSVSIRGWRGVGFHGSRVLWQRLFKLLKLKIFYILSLFMPITEPPFRDLCVPSPCGPNTNCRIINNAAVCECLPGFEGSPTTSGCHPECVINADCPRNKACMRNKCVDPCPGVCGYEAVCQTLNHSPVCSCPPPFIGDPFVECKAAPGKFDSVH